MTTAAASALLQLRGLLAASFGMHDVASADVEAVPLAQHTAEAARLLPCRAAGVRSGTRTILSSPTITWPQ